MQMRHIYIMSSGVAADVLLRRREHCKLAGVSCIPYLEQRKATISKLPEGRLFALDKTRKGESWGE